jgi:hypothetical protein
MESGVASAPARSRRASAPPPLRYGPPGDRAGAPAAWQSRRLLAQPSRQVVTASRGARVPAGGAFGAPAAGSKASALALELGQVLDELPVEMLIAIVAVVPRGRALVVDDLKLGDVAGVEGPRPGPRAGPGPRRAPRRDDPGVRVAVCRRGPAPGVPQLVAPGPALGEPAGEEVPLEVHPGARGRRPSRRCETPRAGRRWGRRAARPRARAALRRSRARALGMGSCSSMRRWA